MVGVRVPARLLKQIGKLAVALSCDRSAAIRWLVEAGLNSGAALLLLRTGNRKARRQADQIVQVAAAEYKHQIAAKAAERTGSLSAALHAHRTGKQAAELRSSLEDRVALKGAAKPRLPAGIPADAPPPRGR
jgi:hypothetical protein